LDVGCLSSAVQSLFGFSSGLSEFNHGLRDCQRQLKFDTDCPASANEY